MWMGGMMLSSHAVIIGHLVVVYLTFFLGQLVALFLSGLVLALAPLLLLHGHYSYFFLLGTPPDSWKQINSVTLKAFMREAVHGALSVRCWPILVSPGPLGWPIATYAMTESRSC